MTKLLLLFALLSAVECTKIDGSIVGSLRSSSGSAPATGKIASPFVGNIKNLNHKTCIDSPDREQGGRLHMWHCDKNNENQQWVYKDRMLRLKNTQWCLDCFTTTGKEHCHLWTCSKSNGNQKFDIVGGYIKTKERCLGLGPTGGIAEPMHLYKCQKGNRKQMFSFPATAKKAKKFTKKMSGTKRYGGYLLGAKGSYCPSGFKPVTGKESCFEAFEAMGRAGFRAECNPRHNYWDEKPVSNMGPGCLYFNQYATKSCHQYMHYNANMNGNPQAYPVPNYLQPVCIPTIPLFKTYPTSIPGFTMYKDSYYSGCGDMGRHLTDHHGDKLAFLRSSVRECERLSWCKTVVFRHAHRPYVAHLWSTTCPVSHRNPDENWDIIVKK